MCRVTGLEIFFLILCLFMCRVVSCRVTQKTRDTGNSAIGISPIEVPSSSENHIACQSEENLRATSNWQTISFYQTSSERYPHNSMCVWSITSDSQIELEIMEAQGEPCEDSDCTCYDFLEVVDVSESAALGAEEYCTDSYEEKLLVSIGSEVILQFTSDESVNGKGFLVRYRAKSQPVTVDQAGCQGMKDPRPGQLIASQNYPRGAYLPNSQCRWTINPSNEFYGVRLQFLKLFNLEKVYDPCQFDFVEINGERYCGDTKPEDLEYIGGPVEIYFESDDRDQLEGWGLIYTEIQEPVVGGTNPAEVSTTIEISNDNPEITEIRLYQSGDLVFKRQSATDPDLYARLLAPYGHFITLTLTDWSHESGCIKIFDSAGNINSNTGSIDLCKKVRIGTEVARFNDSDTVTVISNKFIGEVELRFESFPVTGLGF